MIATRISAPAPADYDVPNSKKATVAVKGAAKGFNVYAGKMSRRFCGNSLDYLWAFLKANAILRVWYTSIGTVNLIFHPTDIPVPEGRTR